MTAEQRETIQALEMRRTVFLRHGCKPCPFMNDGGEHEMPKCQAGEEDVDATPWTTPAPDYCELRRRRVVVSGKI